MFSGSFVGITKLKLPYGRSGIGKATCVVISWSEWLKKRYFTRTSFIEIKRSFDIISIPSDFVKIKPPVASSAVVSLAAFSAGVGANRTDQGGAFAGSSPVVHCQVR